MDGKLAFVEHKRVSSTTEFAFCTWLMALGMGSE